MPAPEVKTRETTPPETAALADGVLNGDRRALARAITLVESTRRDHRAAAGGLLERLVPHAGQSIRLGISGAPGVGKSTFIEALGNHLIDAGHRVAVLTVDPSSAISGGSILGDKTRMEKLSRRPEAYIRPSPSGNTLGGVARRSRESLLLCEAAGFDVIIVETVGVGQSETKVADMTDMFVLLLQPASGDELQGIKRGIMELADLVLVNKADGHLGPLAAQTAQEYRNAISLLHPRSAEWKVEVQTCSALETTGIAEAWDVVLRHQDAIEKSGELTARRAEQAQEWMWSDLQDSLMSDLKDSPAVRERLPELEAAVGEGRVPATTAAARLLEIYLDRRKRG
jgi:LAO/AO transport system kinase